ncbi:uncharacterized protein [Macrobrachium rosenbergii]|uniref:uncharacterized protein n=1 Tax=Macrobrachium rosenbergii TaxID=79674 RepID=UPI0034D59219
MSDDNPTRPFESVPADFFIVIVDRLSGWPVVVPRKGDTTASNTIRIFREAGVPLRLRTDGGPQFTSSEFWDFMEPWGVQHVVTSPYYPQSNGHAEATVKSIKHLILTTVPSGNTNYKEFDRGLLELQKTPNFTGCSPAQILYGRPLRSRIPAHPESFSKEWQVKTEDCDCRAANRAKQVKTRYDQHVHPLPRLTIGQHVRIQDPTTHCWDKVGVVMSFGRSRDYEIHLPSGRIWWRNRCFLHPLPHPSVDPSPLSPVAPCLDREKQSLVDFPHVPMSFSKVGRKRVHSRVYY